ncbi:MAG: hypothetical protein EAZ59_28200, partial [Oscillatoriales cyanobacterium]
MIDITIEERGEGERGGEGEGGREGEGVRGNISWDFFFLPFCFFPLTSTVKSFKSVTSGTKFFAELPSKSGIVLEKEAVECLTKVELARRSYLTQRRYRQDACIHSGVGGRSGQL